MLPPVAPYPPVFGYGPVTHLWTQQTPVGKPPVNKPPIQKELFKKPSVFVHFAHSCPLHNAALPQPLGFLPYHRDLLTPYGLPYLPPTP